mmetsp:Transcript_2395/g.5467  ORF Transcript_2395/g.5467 Transcript_2395/m.5467 type:complete len:952 (+) Transcript_2395:38-2893(+)
MRSLAEAKRRSAKGVREKWELYCCSSLYSEKDLGRKLLRCSRCRAVYYKDRATQISHWSVHKRFCRAPDWERIRKMSIKQMCDAIELVVGNTGRSLDDDLASDLGPMLSEIRSRLLKGDRSTDQVSEDFGEHLEESARVFMRPETMIDRYFSNLWATPLTANLIMGDPLMSMEVQKMRTRYPGADPQYSSLSAKEQKEWSEWERKNLVNPIGVWANFVYTFLVRTATTAHVSDSSHHDGKGPFRFMLPWASRNLIRLSFVTTRRALALWYDADVRKSIGGSMVPAASLALTALSYVAGLRTYSLEEFYGTERESDYLERKVPRDERANIVGFNFARIISAMISELRGGGRQCSYAFKLFKSLSKFDKYDFPVSPYGDTLRGLRERAEAAVDLFWLAMRPEEHAISEASKKYLVADNFDDAKDAVVSTTKKIENAMKLMQYLCKTKCVKILEQVCVGGVRGRSQEAVYGRVFEEKSELKRDSSSMKSFFKYCLSQAMSAGLLPLQMTCRKGAAALQWPERDHYVPVLSDKLRDRNVIDNIGSFLLNDPPNISFYGIFLNWQKIIEQPVQAPDMKHITKHSSNANGPIRKKEGHRKERNKGQLSSKCIVCGKPSTSKCGRCCSASYCGKACQLKDWRTHKLECGRMAEMEKKKRIAKSLDGLTVRRLFRKGETEFFMFWRTMESVSKRILTVTQRINCDVEIPSVHDISQMQCKSPKRNMNLIIVVAPKNKLMSLKEEKVMADGDEVVSPDFWIGKHRFHMIFQRAETKYIPIYLRCKSGEVSIGAFKGAYFRATPLMLGKTGMNSTIDLYWPPNPGGDSRFESKGTHFGESDVSNYQRCIGVVRTNMVDKWLTLKHVREFLKQQGADVHNLEEKVCGFDSDEEVLPIVLCMNEISSIKTPKDYERCEIHQRHCRFTEEAGNYFKNIGFKTLFNPFVSLEKPFRVLSCGGIED